MPRLTRFLPGLLCAVFVLVLADRILGATAAAAEACGTPGAPTATVYLPNVTKTLGGPNGWVTPIYVQNAGTVQTTVELSFHRFRDGSFVACHRTFALAPGTSFVDDPNLAADLPDDTQFSVVARSFGAPIVTVVDQQQESGARQQSLSYSGFAQGDRTVYLPNVTRRFYGYDVPFIAQNVGTAAATVSARFISFDGQNRYTKTFRITPGTSFAVDPDYEPAFDGTPNSGLIDGTQYAVTLTSDQPIAVVANAHNPFGSPVGYSHNGIGRGATTLHAPYAAKAVPPGNTFSPVVVQNLGTTPADAQLTFVTANAAAVPQSFTLRAIPAGGAQAFDPRFALGTIVPCPVASATCLGAGEYALRVTSTNPIAAVVLPNSATTAGAYLASTQLSQRVLVPMAFRRVGGPAGWSTRVVVQTGGPAQLTGRAFALPSGELKATFAVPVGASGTGGFDLGTVAGLTDGTRYSVTVDGDGNTVAAVALTRASTGGDAFSAFEAFGSAALDAIPMPAAIRVTPPSARLFTGWTQGLSATVTDQFGTRMPSVPVSWSTAPAAVGTVTQTGIFTAGSTAAVGAIAVTTGSLTTTVPLSVAAPTAVTLAGIGFWSFPGDAAHVYTETGIGTAGAQTIVMQVDADTAQVTGDYGRAFAGRPVVYALASGPTFFSAIRLIGGSAAEAPTWAAGLCICRDPHPDWVFVNWAVEGRSPRHEVVRHELTHVMQHQIATEFAVLPAWFNEGNAMLEELTLPDSLWWAALQRSYAVSMEARGALFTLAELTSQRVWNERSETDAAYQYAVASQAALFLRDDLGTRGVLLILELMAQGRSFEDAYATVAGRPLADFESAFAARVRALVPTTPGIATAQDSQDGAGLTFIVYGLPANTTISYVISGPISSRVSTRVTDTYGVTYTYLSTSWPPGPYTMTVTWSGGSFSGSGVKLE